MGYRGKYPKTETGRQTVATFKEENSDSTQLEHKEFSVSAPTAHLPRPPSVVQASTL